MRLFCSMMHVASGRVRRKTVSLGSPQTACVFYPLPFSWREGDQNCVSPVIVKSENKFTFWKIRALLHNPCRRGNTLSKTPDSRLFS